MFRGVKPVPLISTLLLLQIMADGTRKTVAELLASSATKFASSLQKRRLIPFKSLPTQMGTVAALTFCLQLQPTLLSLGVVRMPPCPLLGTGAPPVASAGDWGPSCRICWGLRPLLVHLLGTGAPPF